MLKLNSIAQVTQYVGEIRPFAGNFAPDGWLICDGSLLQISEYETLFVIIGTTYGGNGESTFALPDLRGRVPIHQGNGYVLGESGGIENVTLSNQNMPSHSHLISPTNTIGGKVNTEFGTSTSPSNLVPALSKENKYIQGETNGSMPAGTINQINVGTTGGSAPHENRAPSLVVNYIISINGIYPSPN